MNATDLRHAERPLRLYKLMVAGTLVAMSTLANAAEYTRNITISRVASVSVSRPAYPGSQSVFRIYATAPAAWGSSSCRPDAADMSMDDWHMYGILMRAWKESRPIDVTIESTQRIDTTDVVCKIVAVGAN